MAPLFLFPAHIAAVVKIELSRAEKKIKTPPYFSFRASTADFATLPFAVRGRVFSSESQRSQRAPQEIVAASGLTAGIVPKGSKMRACSGFLSSAVYNAQGLPSGGMPPESSRRGTFRGGTAFTNKKSVRFLERTPLMKKAKAEPPTEHS
jgi:hypothetical protein